MTKLKKILIPAYVLFVIAVTVMCIKSSIGQTITTIVFNWICMITLIALPLVFVMTNRMTEKRKNENTPSDTVPPEEPKNNTAGTDNYFNPNLLKQLSYEKEQRKELHQAAEFYVSESIKQLQEQYERELTDYTEKVKQLRLEYLEEAKSISERVEEAFITYKINVSLTKYFVEEGNIVLYIKPNAGVKITSVKKARNDVALFLGIKPFDVEVRTEESAIALIIPGEPCIGERPQHDKIDEIIRYQKELTTAVVAVLDEYVISPSDLLPLTDIRNIEANKLFELLTDIQAIIPEPNRYRAHVNVSKESLLIRYDLMNKTEI